MAPTSITFLGAPLKEDLQASWKIEYLNHDTESLPLQTPPLAWRRITRGEQPVSELEETHEESDYAHDLENLRYGGVGQSSGLRDTTMTDTTLPTQLPNFAFDMSSVMDLEDVYHLTLPARVSLLAVILRIEDSHVVRTKMGDTRRLTMTLGDATSNGLEVTVWGTVADHVNKHLRRLDVILLQDLTVQIYRGQVVGQSRFSTQFTILFRIDRQSSMDDALRPLLVGDLQSERVAAVRDWAMTWIPSDTQPQDTQDCANLQGTSRWSEPL